MKITFICSPNNLEHIFLLPSICLISRKEGYVVLAIVWIKSFLGVKLWNKRKE